MLLTPPPHQYSRRSFPWKVLFLSCTSAAFLAALSPTTWAFSSVRTTTRFTTTTTSTTTATSGNFAKNQQHFWMTQFAKSQDDNNDDNDDDHDKEEPDLFEYFDPLLSPHAYPNGISPNHEKPSVDDIPSRSVRTPSKNYGNPFGFDLLSQKREYNSNNMAVNTNGETMNGATTNGEKTSDTDEDLFEYFDPLLSPHEYPNGISPEHKPTQLQQRELEERYNPLKMDSNVMSGLAPTFAEQDAAAAASSKKKKIGILLMDHGSRNPKSNARLHHLAELYQMTMTDEESSDNSATKETIVVKAAHMEIAAPTIADGLQALLDQGVEEIVCHPYFLSPGRHVVEDIPELVNQAIADLSIEIPVITTDPVGSNTQLMIGAIHSSVREHSQVLHEQKTSG